MHQRFRQNFLKFLGHLIYVFLEGDPRKPHQDSPAVLNQILSERGISWLFFGISSKRILMKISPDISRNLSQPIPQTSKITIPPSPPSGRSRAPFLVGELLQWKKTQLWKGTSFHVCCSGNLINFDSRDSQEWDPLIW